MTASHPVGRIVKTATPLWMPSPLPAHTRTAPSPLVHAVVDLHCVIHATSHCIRCVPLSSSLPIVMKIYSAAAAMAMLCTSLTHPCPVGTRRPAKQWPGRCPSLADVFHRSTSVRISSHHRQGEHRSSNSMCLYMHAIGIYYLYIYIF